MDYREGKSFRRTGNCKRASRRLSFLIHPRSTGLIRRMGVVAAQALSYKPHGDWFVVLDAGTAAVVADIRKSRWEVGIAPAKAI